MKPSSAPVFIAISCKVHELRLHNTLNKSRRTAIRRHAIRTPYLSQDHLTSSYFGVEGRLTEYASDEIVSFGCSTEDVSWRESRRIEAFATSSLSMSADPVTTSCNCATIDVIGELNPDERSIESGVGTKEEGRYVANSQKICRKVKFNQRLAQLSTSSLLDKMAENTTPNG